MYVCVCVCVCMRVVGYEVVTYILYPEEVEQVAPKPTADDGIKCVVQSQT